MEIKAELGQKRPLQALQPHIQVRRLHCLLGLTAEQVLAGLALALEHMSPCLQFAVSAVQVEQRGQEVPLGDLSLAAQQLCQNVHLHLEAALQTTQDGMMEPASRRKQNGRHGPHEMDGEKP